MDVFSRTFQVQVVLTEQILDCIKETLEHIGNGVVIESFYMCMVLGLKNQNSNNNYSVFGESFKERDTRNEFLKLFIYNKTNSFFF